MKKICTEKSENAGKGVAITLQRFVTINSDLVDVDGSPLEPHSASPCQGGHCVPPGPTVTSSAIVTTISGMGVTLQFDADTRGCGHMRQTTGVNSFVSTD